MIVPKDYPRTEVQQQKFPYTIDMLLGEAGLTADELYDKVIKESGGWPITQWLETKGFIVIDEEEYNNDDFYMAFYSEEALDWLGHNPKY